MTIGTALVGLALLSAFPAAAQQTFSYTEI